MGDTIVGQFRRITQFLVRTLGLRKLIMCAASSRYRRECVISRRLVWQIQQAGFGRICQRYTKNGAPKRTSLKYLGLKAHVARAVGDAGRLKLLATGPKRILDLGCGAGYFLYALRDQGHDVLGMDLDDDPMYNDIVTLLDMASF